jgi:thioredoxin:protein disulfide reductase
VNRRLASILLAIALFMLPTLAWADGDGASAFTDFANRGMFIAVGASFVFGLVASLTPCVFPMVPITVAIFGATEAQSRARGAALSATFVLGIATFFTPVGVASAMSGKLMGSALANQWVVLGLAVLFIALASSMFGAFEMALPSGLTNRLSTVGGVGFRGAFVLGLVMGLVAAPCTGPFLTGMIAWIATTRNVALGTACMFSFSLGLGILFFIAGTFAVNLPKGGAWMMGIKWVSGVALAYLAFSYLRDRFEPIRSLVHHPSTAFGIVAGVVALVGLALGLVHVAAERRKSPIAHLSKPMKLASIIPAVAGAAMLISWINLPREAAAGGNAPAIVWQTDEEKGRAQALAEHRPVLIDFGAEWCTACKELEHETFPDPGVRTEAQRFVTIRVDATDDDDPKIKALSEKYKVVGLPTVIMLDKDGKEIVRLNEFVKPPKFLEAMKKVPPGDAVGMN